MVNDVGDEDQVGRAQVFQVGEREKGVRARSHGGVARARRRAHARDSRVFERHRGFARCRCSEIYAAVAQRKEDEASGKRRLPWEESDDDEYDVSKYDEEDDGDDDLQFDATTLEALAKKAQVAPIRARRWGGFGGGFDDDDDDDDEGGFWFDDDDEEDYTSPLDDIDAFIAFSECMNALQGSQRRDGGSDIHRTRARV